MKYRESGMPDECLWDSFFEPEQILRELGVNNNVNHLLDIGCGYGTFLLKAAQLIKGTAIGIDIDGAMIEVCRTKFQNIGIKNAILFHGDITTLQRQEISGFKGKIDYICLFNILHCEEPEELLSLAMSILDRDGKVGVIHWQQGNTPRGPSIKIRPSPSAIIQWASNVGLIVEKQVNLPPYHYGLVFRK
ncbi:MAG: class I SAM-dependent methyltransferase [Deltaproteobacteria bacterium]|jgi:ubiquinone/menaquinone biosynthesis C-methylase UbiE|nr:class I SAM-dependent methyltransferase [Deltaproteobacteria bacterium]